MPSTLQDVARRPAEWIADRGAPGARVRLLCFPHAGGGTTLFRTWPAFLPREIAVCPIQLPGREMRLREAAFDRMGGLVEALCEALPRYCDMPFVFFGHSMGGLIAFELARRLRRLRQPQPARLVVAACRAPHLPPTLRPCSGLATDEFLQEVERLNGTPAGALAHPELRALMLPMLRADFALCESYAYEVEAPLTCPMSALGGASDPHVPPQSIAEWRLHTTGRFHTRLFAGDHFFVRSSNSFLAQLASELEAVAALSTQSVHG